MSMKELTTLKEASRQLGKDYNRVYRAYQRGDIAAQRVGGRLLVNTAKVGAILNALDQLKSR